MKYFSLPSCDPLSRSAAPERLNGGKRNEARCGKRTL
jgi:hypothetical protein